LKRGRTKWLAVLAALLLVVAACGDDDDTPSPPTAGPAQPAQTDPPAPAGPLRIAIVAPSASNDLAFTQSIVDAVNAIKAERGNVEVAVTDGTFVVEDAAAAIRGYADEDYDLVIAHGSQYGGSLQEIAPDFPDVAFAWGTAADTFGLANVYAYEAASDEGGYVMGVMAAALSASDVIGVVGPIEVGDAKLYVDGFAAGAKAEEPATTVNINYTGSFSDVALASEAAQAHAAAGADVLTGTAQMVVGAIGVASDQGLLWFGTQANQTVLAPDIVVASQVYHWEVVLRDILAGVDAGRLGGETYEINLGNGGIVIEYNDGYGLAAAVRQKGDDTVAGIIAGTINTG
jgi:basic membrane lipoprotein Med (substrate-binding protein (PBP1-ABC) superfamily)